MERLVRRLSIGVLWLAMLVVLFSPPPMGSTATTLPGSSQRLDAFIETLERNSLSYSPLAAQKFMQAARNEAGPQQLLHILEVTVLLSSSGSDAEFSDWNNLLIRIARQQGSQRYIDLARLNLLDRRMSQGDLAVGNQIEAIRDASSDWFVKSLANDLIAYRLAGENRTGAALKALQQAHDLIRDGEPEATFASATYFDILSVLLGKFDDVEGAVAASIQGDAALPRELRAPDFPTLRRLVNAGLAEGDEALARKAYAAFDRLARSVGDDDARLRAAAVCAQMNSVFERHAEVLACLRQVDVDRVTPRFMGLQAQVARGLARAHLGDLKGARADLAAIQAAEATRHFAWEALDRLPLLRARILVAEGRPQAAIEEERRYWVEHQRRVTADFHHSIGQLTEFLETDLANLRRNADLQRAMIRLQWLIGAMGTLIFLAAIGAVFLLRRQNARLVEAREQADSANAAKSLFLANISHEIRTPLNGILGMAQAVAGDELSPVQRERIDVLTRSGRGLLAILNDLLDLAKIEAGKLALEAVDFDLAAVISSSRHAFWAAAAAKDLALETHISPSAAGLYRGDPTRLRQIVDNLVANAIKFTPAGRVDVSVAAKDGQVEITVSDTGIGMSDEAAARVFSKFEQADATTSRRFGGTGLGLAIVNDLVTAMGGDISVSSQPGVGTTFRVSLPLARSAGAPSAPSQAIEAAPEAGPIVDSAPLRILAAEDHPVNQLVLRTLLSQFGWQVTLVGDGADAVEQFVSNDWDVVLMDIQMPRLDGAAAARQIRAHEADRGAPRTPLIALTADAMSHQTATYAAAGFDDYIAKPIDATSLLATISRVLARAPGVEA